MNSKRTTRPPKQLLWLVDGIAVGLPGFLFLQAWINARIPTGDRPNDVFPGCFARVVDLHFSTGRGDVHCHGPQWWADIVPAIANALPSPSFGASLAELLWLPLLILLAVVWFSLRVVRAISRCLL